MRGGLGSGHADNLETLRPRAGGERGLDGGKI
jgi:hypothetical protein